MKLTKEIAWLLVALCAAATSACSDDSRDGDFECASLAEGEWDVSGDPRLDGVFRAALMIDVRLRDNEARTRGAIGRLAEAFGVELEPTAPLGDNATIVAGAMQVVVDDAVDWVAWGAGTCVADLPLAHEVDVECLRHFLCDVNGACLPESGTLPPVGCEGECIGFCSGACSGSCLTPVEDGECPGTCYGACDLTAEAACDGDCYGDCSTSCLATASDGSCEGPCMGDCQGICETIHGGQCSGACTGMCGVEVEASCAGECRGSCDAECSGACAGRPFTYCGDETCEHSADCGSLGGILGWTALRATWVDYEVYWSSDAEDDSVAIAALAYEIAATEDEARALIAANEELQALVGGGDYGISAVAGVSAAVEGMLNADLEEFDLPECKIPCVLDALESLSEIMTDIASRAAALVEAQIALLAVLDL